jgi:trehalose 6-phosphate phosphatase
MAVFETLPIPDFADLAILLDIDGTILDIAPTPETVAVPASLPETLTRLCTLTGGAVALVSGRSLRDLDQLFAPLQLPAVAGHGAEFRPLPGAAPDPRPELDPALKRKFEALTALGSGITIEDKGYAIALHYRLAPDKEPLLRDAVANLCANEPAVEIMPGKYVLEVKMSGFNKATGVRNLMKRPPFAGRRPIFIGDDITDEYVFKIMPEFGGLAFSVGDAVGGGDRHFEGPGAVRDWLASIAGMKEDAAQ